MLYWLRDTDAVSGASLPQNLESLYLQVCFHFFFCGLLDITLLREIRCLHQAQECFADTESDIQVFLAQSTPGTANGAPLREGQMFPSRDQGAGVMHQTQLLSEVILCLRHNTTCNEIDQQNQTRTLSVKAERHHHNITRSCETHPYPLMEWHIRGGSELTGERLFCPACTNLVT